MKYLHDYKRALPLPLRKPATWAVHPYRDVATGDTRRTATFLRLTGKGDVWFTEVGSHCRGGCLLDQQQQQAAEVAHLVHRLVPLHKRIKGVYYYHYSGDTNFNTGLAHPDDTPRCAYFVYLRKTSATPAHCRTLQGGPPPQGPSGTPPGEPANQCPQASSASFTLRAGYSHTRSLAAGDADGGITEWKLVRQSFATRTHSFAWHGNGTFSIRPPSPGTAWFEYQVRDDQGCYSGVARVTIHAVP